MDKQKAQELQAMIKKFHEISEEKQQELQKRENRKLGITKKRR